MLLVSSLFIFNIKYTKIRKFLIHYKIHEVERKLLTWLNPVLNASICLRIPVLTVASATKDMYSSKLLISTWKVHEGKNTIKNDQHEPKRKLKAMKRENIFSREWVHSLRLVSARNLDAQGAWNQNRDLLLTPHENVNQKFVHNSDYSLIQYTFSGK